MFALISLFIFAVTAYWYLTRNFNYWKKRGINGPKPLPIFGNLLDILLTPRTDLELNLYKKFGSIYGYYLGNAPVLVVGEPDLIKNILVKDFNVFPQRRNMDSSHPIMKQNLASMMGEDWKRVRSIISPTFTSNKMKLMYPLMEHCMTDFKVHLDDLANKKSNVNIKDIFGNLTLDVIASSAFATELNSRNELNSLFVKHARRLFQVNPLKMLLMRLIPKSVFTALGVSLDTSSMNESQDFYVDVARQIINNRKEGGQKSNDFLQLLLEADLSVTKDENDSSESHHVNEGKEELEVEKKVLNVKSSGTKKLSDDEIIAQAVTFLMAGYETTATTLTYATYELALNPRVQQELYDEVNSSVNSNGRIEYDVLSHLPYLDAVISETLRHHSPAVKITRLAAQQYKVGNTGITVYPGQQVDIPVYAIHHDKKYYDDPFEFKPERFMPENRHNLVPYTYLPFGGGPRNCIGMRFSLLESKMVLAQLVRRYTFFRCDETDVPLTDDPKALLCVPKRAVVGIAMR
ncbi:Cytochrome P450 3A14 [Pseudolycoriella hygida]|uniref:Cytochrome P450 3A14 n=1 Tax=Pseudolycoriella hygida TaxID=35572 RepID=A0A9Q0NBU4_9DIPT|nr:Cytochrome P450 3A14 [Pseudolycoriella hygida]